MNKCSLNKRIVASILLSIYIEMGCSNHYNSVIEQNCLDDQTTTALLNSVPNYFNSDEQIATLALLAEEELIEEQEACPVFSQEVDNKNIDDQESEPVQADWMLARENFSGIKKLDVSTVGLSKNMNDNNEQSRNQELVSPFSASFDREVKEPSNSMQSRDQTITSEEQIDLQTDSTEEVHEETIIDAAEYEPQLQQDNRNILLFARVTRVLAFLLLVTGVGFGPLINTAVHDLFILGAIIFIGICFGALSIIAFKVFTAIMALPRPSSRPHS